MTQIADISGLVDGEPIDAADVATPISDLDTAIVQNTPVGVIFPYAGASAPTGWLLADGSAISRTTYANLFTLIGTTYGAGDGSTTFNLPNLKGKVPVGLDAAQTEFDTLGETGGAKTHTLSIAEMPSHAHNSPSGFFLLNIGSGGGASVPGGATVTSSTGTANTGGDGAHNNLQPYITLNFIIKY